MKEAFNKIKTILAADIIMAYPDCNVPSHIYTNESDYQMRFVVIQHKCLFVLQTD